MTEPHPKRSAARTLAQPSAATSMLPPSRAQRVRPGDRRGHVVGELTTTHGAALVAAFGRAASDPINNLYLQAQLLRRNAEQLGLSDQFIGRIDGMLEETQVLNKTLHEFRLRGDGAAPDTMGSSLESIL